VPVNREKPSAIKALALPAAVVAISFSAIFIRLATAPALVIASYRLLITTFIVAPPALTLEHGELRRLSGPETGLAVLGGFFLAGHFYAWIASLALTSIAHSVLFVSTHPLFVIVASRFLFAEKITLQAVVGAVLALAGIAVISGGTLQAASETLPGDFLALTGAVMMAGYLLVGRSLRRSVSTLAYTLIVYGTAAVVLTAAALIIRMPLYPYPAADYLLFAALAIIPTIMGHTVFNWALRRFSATLISLLFLGEPIGATVLAWLIFREHPAAFFFPGAALVLSGLFLVVTRKTKESGPAQTPPGLPR